MKQSLEICYTYLLWLVVHILGASEDIIHLCIHKEPERKIFRDANHISYIEGLFSELTFVRK
jgi:hypothetical protein